MTLVVASKDNIPTTAERILDAAEDLFAQKGYSATSLGDVADRVGIRSPSLYNHFRNKEALYASVLERLLVEFSKPLLEMQQSSELSQERILQWLDTIVRQHHANPNLARLLQHAALSGGPHTNEIIERLFSPMFQSPDEEELEGDYFGQLSRQGLQPWAVMAFNNLVMSYVTMAPMYRDLLGQDPFSEEALEQQLALVNTLLKAVFAYRGD
ncbi:TetR/AcrR family transcriptional regulator [Pseudohalioglobus lutimaris]|uniref:TetR/AcrR family transcriptional regulator n=1 Tax=Pseudohalioglobus lutimaris TaxID=1737061 RepID=A0A2N5WZE1_9GAMM|nr:TetR/AcrR family transcriptional regulator [Pseudohalioglobus lutimaris]PLW67610.1 TetR/AcrR family transcriptional regulator [Pseudohalioglobus lutimaris]